MNPTLHELLTESGVVVRRDHPELAGAIDAAVRAGRLVSVLPGVYTWAATGQDWRVHAAAALAYADDAVITGSAAAVLGFGSRARVRQVEAYHRHRVRLAGPITWHTNSVPVDWITERHGLRFSAPAWTAVELAGSGCADWLDEALRAGVRLSDLWSAFGDMKGRRGAVVRRRLLKESRDEPWSPAERLAHREFRAAGLKGWRTNYSVAGYYLDIAFVAEKLYIEIDGYAYHSSRADHERDSLRGQVLAANGWMALHITWRQLIEDPAGVLARVRMALRQRRRWLGLTA